jgi:dimethylglycine dehydrogenase
VVRDPYAHAYLREETDGILVGPYETQGAHVCWDGRPPAWDFESELVAPELDRLMPWLEKATERLPLFGQAGIKSVVSGAITHTPDANFLLGPAHGPRGYWMANGASVGICQGAGAGKYLAQWMVHGAAEINMREFDPRRFGGWAAGRVRGGDLGHRLPAHVLLLSAGRAARHGPSGADLVDLSQAQGPRRPVPAGDGLGAAALVRPVRRGRGLFVQRSNWWEPVREECLAVRNSVGLTDLSTFAKYDVRGRDAAAFLDRLAANRRAAARRRHRAGPSAHRFRPHRKRDDDHPAGARSFLCAVGRHRPAARPSTCSPMPWRRAKTSRSATSPKTSAAWCWPGPWRATCSAR